MFQRYRGSVGRHPPPLAPTVSTFKPRAEWSSAASSMFLYVNLPGFYRDQIQIRSDERTRTIHIQGQRPLSTQTRARFNEYYRVPDSCDMTRIKTSFLHGLLTIEMPILDVTQNPDKKVQKPAEEERRVNGGLGRKQPPKDDKPVGSSGLGQKAKEEEVRAPAKVVEDKKVAAIGQGKSQEKAKEEEGRTSVITDRTLQRKKPDKPIEQMSVPTVKEEETRLPVGSGGLGLKKEEKDGKASEDVARQQKEIASTERGTSEPRAKDMEEIDSSLGSKKPKKEEEEEEEEEKKKKRVAEKASEEQKTKEREETNGSLGSKQPEKEEKLVEEKAMGQQIQEQAKQKKPEEGHLREDVADKTQNEIAIVKPVLEKEESKDGELSKPELEESKKTKKPITVDEDTKKTIEQGSESGTVHDATSVVAKDQREINSDTIQRDDLRKNLLERMEEEQLQKHGKSLVNVGVAALVIMGFGAYVFLPILKLFY